VQLEEKLIPADKSKAISNVGSLSVGIVNGVDSANLNLKFGSPLAIFLLPDVLSAPLIPLVLVVPIIYVSIVFPLGIPIT